MVIGGVDSEVGVTHPKMEAKKGKKQKAEIDAGSASKDEKDPKAPWSHIQKQKVGAGGLIDGEEGGGRHEDDDGDDDDDDDDDGDEVGKSQGVGQKKKGWFGGLLNGNEESSGDQDDEHTDQMKSRDDDQDSGKGWFGKFLGGQADGQKFQWREYHVGQGTAAPLHSFLLMHSRPLQSG